MDDYDGDAAAAGIPIRSIPESCTASRPTKRSEPMQPRSRSERKWRMYGTTVLRDAQWQVATVHLSNVAKP